MRSSFWNQPAIRSETMGSPSLSASHQAILKQARLLGRRGPAQPSVPQKAWSTNLDMHPFHSSKNLYEFRLFLFKSTYQMDPNGSKWI